MLRCLFLPALAHVDPFLIAGTGLQLRDGEFYRTAAASRCRVHDIEPLHGNIQVYLYPGTVHCKGAHAADGMSCKINDFLRWQHFGFRMKILLIFVIVDLGVPCCHDEHTDIIHLEGQGLGNLRRDDTHRMGRQLHGFDVADAVLTGVETRSSSPVRVTRGVDGQSVGVAGLWPVGEGAGYAGGIMSAATDGIMTARKVVEALGGGAAE